MRQKKEPLPITMSSRAPKGRGDLPVQSVVLHSGIKPSSGRFPRRRFAPPRNDRGGWERFFLFPSMRLPGQMYVRNPDSGFLTAPLPVLRIPDEGAFFIDCTWLWSDNARRNRGAGQRWSCRGFPAALPAEVHREGLHRRKYRPECPPPDPTDARRHRLPLW